MTNTKEFNLLFACTSDFFQYATVTALSAIENISEDIQVNVHFLYADIVEPIFTVDRRNYIDKVRFSLKRKNVTTYFYNVQKYMYMFEEMPCGMWDKKVSTTHYMYLLSQIVLPDIDRALYLDTDMIVNCDLSNVYFENMGNKLIKMISPTGLEIRKDMSNSGFIILDLKQWREENILEKLLDLGKNLKYCGLCDQYLLYEYFNIRNLDRLGLVDYRYNIFPQFFPNLSVEESFVIHYTAVGTTKPWDDYEQKALKTFIWWHYAKMTCFYQNFVMNAIRKKMMLPKKKKFLLKNLKSSFEQFKQNYKLKKLLKKKQVCLWGCSLFLEHFLYTEKVNTKNVLGIIDKNPIQKGNFIGDIEVFSVEDLASLKPKYIISTIKNSHASNYLKIKDFLKEKYPEIELLPNIFE